MQGVLERYNQDKQAAGQNETASLLDLGAYEQMAELAGQRAAAAKAEVGTLEARLRDLADATPDAIAAAAVRADRLAALVERLDVVAPELAALDAEAETARARAQQLDDEIELLRAVRVPSGVDELHDRLAGTAAALEHAAVGLAAAEEVVRATETALA